MKRFNPITLLLITPLFLVATAPGQEKNAAQEKNATLPAESNAAVQYWQAFALMPTLDKEQEKLLEQWNTVPLDPAAQKLIDASENSLKYLRRAAEVDRCDWGLDYNDGISLMLPHLAKSRDLARLAALHARREFQQKHWKAGQTDAAAMMTLGRHVGRDSIMVSVLVRISIEGIVVDLLAPHIPDFRISYADAVTKFSALPAAATVQQSIATERKFVTEWVIVQVKAEEQRSAGGGLKLWRKIVDSPEVPESIKQIQTTAEVIKLTEEIVPIYEELAKYVSLPKSEFDARYPAFVQKTNAAHPLASVLLPPIDKVLAKESRNQARLAMLLAAIAVVEGSPDKLNDIPDPFGGKPFEYRALEKGFELRSALLYDNQPVTLSVGHR